MDLEKRDKGQFEATYATDEDDDGDVDYVHDDVDDVDNQKKCVCF